MGPVIRIAQLVVALLLMLVILVIVGYGRQLFVLPALGVLAGIALLRRHRG